MRLLPRSLFSRLMLVLLGGLAVAQLLSYAIHMRERGELLLQASGVQSAQRVAEIVRLLESADPAGRRRIARVLSAPPLLVSLDRGLMAAPPGAGSDSARGALFGAMLGRLLGGEWR
ncbi:MAG: two-component sensor histidine kinase, partial [Candidatus Parcubacteria bacterium]|nr:two-component sensor histidine kinase [Burkholderiales bacterium]